MLKIIFVSSLLSICFISLSVAQTSTAKWQSQALIIDGDGTDWGGLPRFFNSDSNIKYEFRNDAQNLYIIIKAADRTTLMQQILAGFNVKLKLKNETALRMSVNFLAKKTTDMPITPNPGRIDKLLDKTITKPNVTYKDTATTEGFQFSNGMLTSENTSNTINFACNKMNKESGAYEIQIALKEIFGANFRLEDISTTIIQFQFIINELSQKEINRMRGNMHSRRGQGIPGGGMSGGAGMQESEMRQTYGNEMDYNYEMQGGIRGQLSMERKSFNKDFVLSNGK